MKMSPFFLVAAAAAFLCPASNAEAPAGYMQVWSDEFEGHELDASKWIYRTDSRHWSTQTPANVSLDGGTLVISLRKEDAGGKAYTGGGVISRQPFRYGYYEARFRVPSAAGWHTSFWLMRHDTSRKADESLPKQEIDIVEQDSVDPLSFTVNLHDWQGKHKSWGFRKIRTPNLAESFNTWGCEFTKTHIRYFFNGNQVQELDARVLSHGDHHIWLTSIASWLGNTKAVDDTRLATAAIFDYVRVYSRPGPETPSPDRVQSASLHQSPD